MTCNISPGFSLNEICDNLGKEGGVGGGRSAGGKGEALLDPNAAIL